MADIFQVATGVMISYFVNYGIGIHQANSSNIWRVPFGFQLVPAGILLFGLFTIKVRFFSLLYQGSRLTLLCRNPLVGSLPSVVKTKLSQTLPISAKSP